MNLPEPHLPVMGLRYREASNDNMLDRVLFMGWETRNHCRLSDWLEALKSNRELALGWYDEEIENFEFIKWRTNLGKDFWSFNLRVLAKLHGIADWRELYRKPDLHSNILNSFAWANCCAIERFEVTARGKGCEYKDWETISNAARIFDNPPLIFNTLNPTLIILMHWDQDEDLLLKGMQVLEEAKIHEDYLWYYKVRQGEAVRKIFWTNHPRGMPSLGIEYDGLIAEMLTLYKNGLSFS